MCLRLRLGSGAKLILESMGERRAAICNGSSLALTFAGHSLPSTWLAGPRSVEVEMLFRGRTPASADHARALEASVRWFIYVQEGAL